MHRDPVSGNIRPMSSSSTSPSAVLMATLGTEPQVVTLMLDALLARHIPIQRVEVIHTHDPQTIQPALNRLTDTFLSSRTYPGVVFVPHVLVGTKGPLSDITTSDEIDSAFRQMYGLLHQHKQAQRTVHLSIAGGRKTMTVFALAAAQWTLTEADAVWHMVSSPTLIQSKALHAPADDPVQIIRVPLTYQPAESAAAQVQRFFNQLTPAEQEIASVLLREGLSNRALAARLNKSPSTVANQLTGLYQKCEAFFHLPSVPDRALFIALLSRYI